MSSRAIRLLVAACALLLSVSAAVAQTSFGPQQSNGVGMVRLMLPVPAGDTGPRRLTVDYAGDLSDPGQVITVTVGGIQVGTLTGGGADCTAVMRQVIEIDSATYSAAAAHGSLHLTFDATGAATPVATVCGTATPYTGPFAGLNGTLSGFAVVGTLSASGAAPGAQQSTDAALRGTLALTYGPDRSRRIAVLNGGGGDGQTVSVDGMTLFENSPFALDLGAQTLSFAAATGGDGLRLWAEGRVLAVDDATTRDQLYGLVHAGVETIIADTTLIGLGLTLDRLTGTEIATGDDSTARGWMIGPALTHRFAGGLYLDGRAAWGQVETEIDRAPGGTDRYGADRALVDLALVGQARMGALTLEPRAAYGWYREQAEGYTATGFGPVAGSTTTVRQGTLGARLSGDLDTGAGQVMPFIDLSTAFADISGGALTPGSAGHAADGWSGQIGFGADYTGDTGAVWSAELGLGGLGTDAQTLTGRISLSIPF